MSDTSHKIEGNGVNRDKAIIEAIIAQRNEAMSALAICQADLACANAKVAGLEAIVAAKKEDTSP